MASSEVLRLQRELNALTQRQRQQLRAVRRPPHARPPSQGNRLRTVAVEREKDQNGKDLDLGQGDGGDRHLATSVKAARKLNDRNKRMFGLLMGHLGKARERVKDDENSEHVNKKRKAEERAASSVEAMRQEAKDRMWAEKEKRLEEREHHREKLQELRDEIEKKKTRLKALRLVQKAHRVSQMLPTTAQPCIYWTPRKPTVETQKRLNEWKIKCMENTRAEVELLGFDFKEVKDALDGHPSQSDSVREEDVRDDEAEEGAILEDTQDSELKEREELKQGEIYSGDEMALDQVASSTIVIEDGNVDDQSDQSTN